MAVLGSIYGSFVQNSLSLGVSGSFWELLGVFTIALFSSHQQHRNSPDSAYHVQEPSRQSTY